MSGERAGDSSSTAPPAADDLASRVSWLLAFRTIIVTVLLVGTTVMRFGAGGPLFGPATVVLYGVCAVSYVLILVGALWLRRHRARGAAVVAYTQLLADSVVATVLIVSTGGHESAFVFLYSLSILNAAAVIGRPAGLTLATVNAALYLTIVLLQTQGGIRDVGLVRVVASQVFPTLFANVLALYLVAFLAGSLTTELRRTSARLDEARVRLTEFSVLHEAVLESLPSGVLTLDEHDRVTFVNHAGADILARERPSVVGRAVEDVLGAVPSVGADSTRFEITRGTARGERVIGGSVASLSGSARARVVVFQDLTELRRLQSAVSRADRLRTLGAFAAGLAHELRNPLAAMIGCLELLAIDVDASSENARLVEIVRREAERLSRLVSDFLIYARPPPPKLEPVSLLALVDETIAPLREKDATRVSISVEGDADLRVLGDAGQLRQIVFNLTTNAIQAAATRTGGKGAVHLAIKKNHSNGILTVDDDGPGLNADQRAHLFEPFFTTKPSGTGLGLATSHQLTIAQDGELDVARSLLGGACFELRLPLAAGAARG